jgi:hypothetical protein
MKSLNENPDEVGGDGNEEEDLFGDHDSVISSEDEDEENKVS